MHLHTSGPLHQIRGPTAAVLSGRVAAAREMALQLRGLRRPAQSQQRCKLCVRFASPFVISEANYFEAKYVLHAFFFDLSTLATVDAIVILQNKSTRNEEPHHHCPTKSVPKRLSSNSAAAVNECTILFITFNITAYMPAP